jgi:hypothetical protein
MIDMLLALLFCQIRIHPSSDTLATNTTGLIRRVEKRFREKADKYI